MRYIVVFHNWFVSSNGFTVKTLDAKDREGAEKEAKIMCYELDMTFSKCAYTVVEIASNERASKLTFKERLFGRLYK